MIRRHLCLSAVQQFLYDFFFNDTATTEIYTLSLHDALPILTLSSAKAVIVRDIEGGEETLECSLPCVITAEKGLNEPRYPSLKGIMQAKKKTIEIKDIQLNASGFEILSLSYPPQKPTGRIVGTGPEAAPELIRLLRDEAKVI